MKCTNCDSDIQAGSDFCTRCGSPVPDQYNSPTWYTGRKLPGTRDFSFAPGDSLGKRYEIAAEIGRGGMGKIFKARDKELDIFVAIKMIHPELLTNPDTVKRLKKELLMAREISHENVVRIHDFFDEGDVKFISMQYIEGQNLNELIRSSGPLDTKTAVNIFKQLCRGLKAAHNQGIIHRDLKPQNIMIDKTGKAYISDFGLAKSLEEKGMSMSGIVMGTPQYLSPEQAMGEKLDRRSDIYNLGIIMYEMITGKELFSSETVLGYLQKHIREKPTSPSAINTLIPPFLEKIILKCLQKNRDKRYGDVEDILEDLEREKAASTFFYPKKIKKIAKISAAAVLILITALILYFILGNGDREEPPPLSNRKAVAVLYFQNDTGKTELDHWRSALPTLLITDLAQSPLLKVLPEAELFQIMADMEQLENTRYSLLVLGQIAAKANVDHLILGNYTKAGATFLINSRILDVRSEKLRYLPNVQGKEEHLFTLVDDLTKNIKKKLEFTRQELKADIDKEVDRITTTSTEALKHYVAGKRCVYEGNFRESIEYFEKAIKIDAKFAMAYRDMAWAYAYLGDLKNREKYFRKTLELLDHISPRERYIIQGDIYGEAEETFDKSIAAYQKLLEHYPGDNEALRKLGMAYSHKEQWDMAIKQLSICQKKHIPDIVSLLLLVRCYMAKGMYNNARQVLDDYGEQFDNHYLIHKEKGLSYLTEGKYDLALAELDRAIALQPGDNPLIILKGNIYLLKGNLKRAEEQFKLFPKDKIKRYDNLLSLRHLYLLQGKFTASEGLLKEMINLARFAGNTYDIQRGYVFLAYSYLNSGKVDEALKAADRVLDNELQKKFAGYARIALYFKALAHLEKREIEIAEAIGEKLKISLEKGAVRNNIKFYFHFLGVKELKKKNFAASLKHLLKAVSYLNKAIYGELFRDHHALFFSTLASAYYQSGDLDKAEREYKNILALTTGRLLYGDIYALSLYRLGKIYRAKGEKSKAVEYFERFLSLWKDADRGIKEVEDAKRQLDVLKLK
ncbi:MAG: protein kinase [Candidatus Aminicenantes bacterium]|nr:protein kinase [Candidatus Aminicenantes bacterium]